MSQQIMIYADKVMNTQSSEPLTVDNINCA